MSYYCKVKNSLNTGNYYVTPENKGKGYLKYRGG